MGQAKHRGTYAIRKSAAIADNEKIIQLLKEQEEVWWNSLSEDEQQSISENRINRVKALSVIKNASSLLQ